MSFKLLSTDLNSQARRGELTTSRGVIQTPVFMPVGTQGTVKAVSPAELHELGAEIILGNTYHLNVRPGMEIMAAAGGLHSFMNWDRPILTDSGGYQVFSLAKLNKIRPDGVEFQSHVDGTRMFIGPAESMAIQRTLGSDIVMAFDECTPYPCEHDAARQSLEMTMKWEAACLECELDDHQQLFGIVQGSMYEDLRIESAQRLGELPFSGFAVGGVSVGEPEELMYQVCDWTVPHLPADKPRYLMGVGTPPQLVEAVSRGIDMFDCVLPTRVGRNGSIYTKHGMVQMKAARFKDDFGPVDEDCSCYTCTNFSRAYLRHLLNVGEILGLRLTTLHNLHFYLDLMRQMRGHIEAGTFAEFRREFAAGYRPPEKRD
jgi:queuine tRNA-ribosyltransferase